jgi:hypothetical protein
VDAQLRVERIPDRERDGGALAYPDQRSGSREVGTFLAKDRDVNGRAS